MLRGLYTGKILALNLISQTIMALLSRTSLKGDNSSSTIQPAVDQHLKGDDSSSTIHPTVDQHSKEHHSSSTNQPTVDQHSR